VSFYYPTELNESTGREGGEIRQRNRVDAEDHIGWF